MTRSPERRRLRWLMAGFFLALALPSVLLVRHAYGQLKWQALHQQQLLAEEVAARIEARLADWLAREEARPADAYGFLVVEGQLLQRSVLSEFPPSAAIPGLIGHFQIDAAGQFSSPLEPPPGQATGQYGIDPAQAVARQEQAGRLHAILARNALVARSTADAETPAGAEPRPDADTEGRALAKAEPAAPAATFADAIDEQSRSNAGVRRQLGETLGSVAELQLDEFGGEKEQEAARSDRELEEETVRPERRKRLEQSNLPQPQEASSEDDQVLGVDRDFRITTFATEVDPFDFALLDSGHFVLYRTVWRQGERIVQGALIDPEAFLAGLVEPAFTGSVARSADLLVAFRDEVIRAFNAAAGDRYTTGEDLAGTVIHRTRLPSPMAGLELIFIVSRLPLGAGATVLGWLAALLAGVLLLGTWLLYRLGLRQLQLAEQQRDFVSAVSHELKTPLTSIRMYAEMLRAGWADPEKVRGYYDYIYAESERLSRLIANVLHLSRITHRQDSGLEPSLHSGAELVALVEPKIRALTDAAGFELAIDCPAEAAHANVRIDPDAFSQVIINLVDNAIKFSARAALRRLEISLVLGEEKLTCRVRDYGPGIPRQQMKKIFELFFRPEGELTRETVGTGIGLALVRELVTAMDGTVDVRNREPGAEFSIDLPLVRPRT